jgi:HK97 family phage prohead protease
MPWHIETDNPDCAGGFAVVKDEDGAVVGCHETEAAAQDQITALNIAEAEDRGPYGVDLTVNGETQSAAARGLRLHEAGKSGDGIVPATVRDAVRMARREELSEDKVRRMPAWFARHEGDWTPGTDDQPGDETPGYVAWLLWGGDPGRAWADRKVRELDRAAAEEDRTMIVDRDGEEYVMLTARQKALAEAYEGVTETFGRFDQSIGPDGAHYMVSDDNPFIEEGMACSNCVAFRGGGACEWVQGEIQPEGLCKLWVIAADKLVGVEPQPAPDYPAESEDDNEGGSDELQLIGADAEESAMPEIRIERAAPMARVEWRVSGVPDNRNIKGYAAVFNSMSHDLGGFREVIAPGAFQKVLERGADVRLLYNHDDGAVMARTKSGTLELVEDEVGLRIWARVDMADPDVQRVIPKMMRADVDQMSFAFTVEEDEWDESGGYPLRTIRSVGELYEVSIVPFPAYEATKAEVYERARSEGRVLVARATPTVAEPSPGGSESQVDDLGMGRSRSDEARIRAAKWRARLSHHRLNTR